MKKVIFGLIIFSFFLQLSAQNVTYGVKGGLNIANLSTDDLDDDNQSIFGFHIAGLTSFKLNYDLALQTEVMLSTQGSKIEFDSEVGGNTIENEIRYKLTQINIPIMVHYATEGVGSTGWFAETGPQIGFLVSKTFDAEVNTNGMTETSEGDLDDFHSIDFGWNFGAGYHLKSNMSIGLRFNLGLVDFSKRDDFEAKSVLTQLSFIYRL